MTESHLWSVVSDKEIQSELRRRKQRNIYLSVSGSTLEIINQKVIREKQDGWRISRRNLRSVRLAKQKLPDELLEDEVWSIFAQMGFKEMSCGRQFAISVKTSPNPWQIDVFAKDDETALIVKCAHKETIRSESIDPLINKILSAKYPIEKSVIQHYGKEPRIKIKFVIATRDIQWRESDLEKCKRNNIVVITDNEIDYYLSLVKYLKHAARYQLLAHMFGNTRIMGLANKKVVATRSKMGGEKFYTFLIRPSDLLKIAYVGHKSSRDVENIQTYQRMLQPHRLKRIAKYINNGGKFPTNIVVNLKSKRNLKFDGKEALENESLGVLQLPDRYASAWIIDGQHRLYGYAYASQGNGFKEDKSTIPVLAFENLTAEKEMNLFIDINSKQVKVNKGLLGELYSGLHWKSDNKEEAFQALLSRIASRLNSEKNSPIFERVLETGKKKTHFRCLTQTSIRDGLSKAKLIGTVIQGNISPGPLATAKSDEYDKILQKSLFVLIGCLSIFAEKLSGHWTLGDDSNGYLCTNNGIRAIFHVIYHIAEHVRLHEKTDLTLCKPDEAVEKLSPFLSSLAEYFHSATNQDIHSFRKTGSSLDAVKRQSLGMCAQIHKRHSDFNPDGLQEYLDSRDEQGSEEAAKKVTDIHKTLSEHVINALKANLGTEKKVWWTSGVPLRIRTRCTGAWEESGRNGEEETYLFLIDYVEICTQNWGLVKQAVSLGERDIENKKKNTSWIKKINEIRQITTHPEKGNLNTEQVKFVNSIYEKVEQFF